eukprot:683038-Rhodomonas_salina.1
MATGRPIVRMVLTPRPSVSCSQHLKLAVLKTYTSSTKLTSSHVKTEAITFDTAADGHVVNSNKHIKNKVHSHNTVVGVNQSAPTGMTGLTEGDWSFTVKDENGNTSDLGGRATVVPAVDKNLALHVQLINDGIVEYALLGRSDNMSHLCLTDEHCGHSVPL